MSFGISLPSFSGIRDAVTNTVSSATHTVRDLGGSALKQTADLGRDGLDLGRRAVEAVRSVDVREAAAAVRQKIGEGTEAAREGIKTGVEFAGRKTHEAADFARAHVPGGDNVVSNGIRGAITVAEDNTRFQLGVVGGVAREAVGLVGTAGQLGTTLTEMQLSPEASVEYGQKIVDGAKSAATATGSYVTSVAHDPSRLGSDIGHVAEAGEHWAGGQIDRYEQAFRDGKGFETVGMDVGTVATYVVPVGGGPVRGALTAVARGGGEAAARGGAEVLARGGAEAVVRDGGNAVARGTVETTARAAGSEAAAGIGTAEAGTIRNVNIVGGKMNCVNCAVATDSVLAGRPASALGGGPFQINRLEAHFGARFSPAMSSGQIISTMEAAGNGARGIVFGSRGSAVGHVFNVVNQSGTVRFLDGQIGGAARLDGFSALHLLRTN